MREKVLGVLAIVAVGVFIASPVQAAIVFTGSNSPIPANWNSSTNGYIGGSSGGTGTGTVTVTSGNALASANSYLGDLYHSSGTATVDGAGSTWTNSSSSDVGSAGLGTLNLTNGGAVNTTSSGFIGYTAVTGSGTVTVSGAGSTWTVGSGQSTQQFCVGFSGFGTLNITNGGAVNSQVGFATIIADGNASQSFATVDGAGSTWTNASNLLVGDGGVATLTITNGSTVSVAGATEVGSNLLNTNSLLSNIQFGAHGGTLTTQSLYTAPSQLLGTGTINTNGLVSDVNLTFDATHGLSQTITGFGSVAVNLNMSNSNNVGDLGAGYQGSSSLTIQNGVVVNSNNGILGYFGSATGIATVSGAGSTWNMTGNTSWIGELGNGTLNITNGGTVNSSGTVSMGANGGSSGGTGTGTVIVDGAGSTWNANILHVGGGGNATLKITNGGVVNDNSALLDGYPNGTQRWTEPARCGTPAARSAS